MAAVPGAPREAADITVSATHEIIVSAGAFQSPPECELQPARKYPAGQPGPRYTAHGFWNRIGGAPQGSWDVQLLCTGKMLSRLGWRIAFLFDVPGVGQNLQDVRLKRRRARNG